MSTHPIFAKAGSEAVPVVFVTAASFDRTVETFDERGRAFVRASGFEAKPGRHLLLPAPDGALAAVLFGLEDKDAPGKDLFRPGSLAGLLPAGTYRFANAPHDARLAASPSRSTPIDLRATGKAKHASVRLVRARRRRRRRPLAHRRRRDAMPRSHQYARRTTWGRPNSKMPHASSPNSTAQIFGVIERQ